MYAICGALFTTQTRRVWGDLGYFNIVIYTVSY